MFFFLKIQRTTLYFSNLNLQREVKMMQQDLEAKKEKERNQHLLGFRHCLLTLYILSHETKRKPRMFIICSVGQQLSVCYHGLSPDTHRDLFYDILYFLLFILCVCVVFFVFPFKMWLWYINKPKLHTLPSCNVLFRVELSIKQPSFALF